MQTPRDEWAGQSAFGDVVVSRWLQDPCIPNTDTQREVKVSISLKTPYLLPQVEIKDMNVHRDSISPLVVENSIPQMTIKLQRLVANYTTCARRNKMP